MDMRMSIGIYIFNPRNNRSIFKTVYSERAGCHEHVDNFRVRSKDIMQDFRDANKNIDLNGQIIIREDL